MIRTTARTIALAFAFAAGSIPAFASIGLVVGEPFGAFGTMMPAGHAGIYLDRVCAETPTRLRPCHPGEYGVVLSRYHDLRATNLDWIAVPAIPFFYGVDDPANTPTFITHSLEAEIREAYREANLTSVAPGRIGRNGTPLAPRYGDWEEGIGATFDRRILLYTIDTTLQQDAALIAILNAQPNHRRYTLRRADCADFAAALLNTVLPGVFRRNELADFDIMSPKNLARQLDTYGRLHPGVNLRIYELPQIPGTLRRSRPLRGAAETLLKTKRYLTTLLLIQPEAVLADWIVYEKKGKWTPGLDATSLTPTGWQPIEGSLGSVAQPGRVPAIDAYSPASTSSSAFPGPSGFFAK